MAKVDALEFIREEDFVEYYIFPRILSNNEKDQEEILNSTLQRVSKTISKYCNQYLWHKDEFRLVSKTKSSCLLDNEEGDQKSNLPPHLYGITHYGDNIADEWFIVFLLQQITKEHSDLIARVADADGEFILIEAANCLPSWAEPEICENRVYFFKGLINLVPPENLTEKKKIDIPTALNTIRNMPTETVASTEIQNCISDKLSCYPDEISKNLHHAIAYLPNGIAAILKHKPNLISPAVRAFCNRDTVDMKACRAMKYFPPENRVYRRVVFTKCLYAMVTHSKFVPDRRTGWNLPPPASDKYKAHVLGMKIACGFEILIAQAKPNQDIEHDKGWHGYLKSLKEKDYFRGLLENSRDYNNLLNKAKEYYLNHRDSMHYAPVIGQEILDLTRTLDYKVDELKEEENNLPADDDDSWLDVSPEELDKMLQERYGQKKVYTVNENSDASNFSEKVTKFLSHISDIDGAEFPNLESPRRPPRGVKKRDLQNGQSSSAGNDDKDNSNNKINFDPSSFSCAVQNILNFVVPEDNWASESDMSEYEDEAEHTEPTEIKNKMQEYMDEMDRELAATTIGKSFEKKMDTSDTFDDIEDFKPVDLDMNALKNMLESYRSQMGEAGPSSNMLGPMGIHLDTESKVNGRDKESD